ncbi:MAG: hypothetical protein K0R20_1977 [Actinomycetia bacterium]|jgi:hypothetical protein|nr:hypothetical protein [Actinomycetes bacterium]
MQRERRVQVVLGEAERADGLLRFVLEAEGFDLIGMASNEEELSRVLRGAKPSVLVLDGGISAAAALDARQRIDGAALVVVWPDGVSAVLAEERVEPHMVIEDLGDAVRRAAARVERADTIVVPEAETHVPAPAEADVSQYAPVTEPEPPLPQPWRRRGRAAQVLVAAATWLLVITAFTAIAAAVPHVVDTFRGKQNAPRPSSVPPSERPAGAAVSTVTPPSGPEGSAHPDLCEDEVRGQGADLAAGEGSGDPVRAQGCPKDRETTSKGSAAGGDGDNSGSQGGGDGSPGVSPEEPGDPGAENGQPDDPGSQGAGNGPPDDPGSQGEDKDDQGNQGEGNGPPEQTGDQTPQGEDPMVGQNGSSEAVDGAARSDQDG